MSKTTPIEPGRLSSLPPTEPLQIGGGLSLFPRLKLLLTFFRPDLSTRPFDEWKLKQALLSFLPSVLSQISDEDLLIFRVQDLHKRKRNESVATGTLYVRDFEFLKVSEVGNGYEKRKKFVEWRGELVERLSGIELNIEGVMFNMAVEVPMGDDFERMKKSWEEEFGARRRMGMNRNPDTIIVRGVPSRWFAEPRVSSKASMLVTHEIFSAFGRIRNINVAGDDGQTKEGHGAKGEINLSGLNCKVWVQFETYEEFCCAMNVLCGRSMQKEGSRLKVDYEVFWDQENFFRNTQQKPMQNQSRERERERKRDCSSHIPKWCGRNEKNHESSHQIHADSARRKRFKD